MSFAQIRQAMGQKDQNNYDVKITMFGLLLGPIEQGLTKNGKPKSAGTIVDDAGEKHKVHFIGNNLPGSMQINQRISMSLSAFNGQGQGGPFIGYSGFWNATQQVNQPQASPQLPPQMPQTAPGSTIPPQQGVQAQKPDWDAIARGKVRNGLVVADRQQGRSWFQVLDPQNVKEIEVVVEYICTGQVGLIPTDDGDGPDYGPQDNPGDFSWDSPASDDDVTV